VVLGARKQILTGFLKALRPLMDSAQNYDEDDDDYGGGGDGDDDDETERYIFWRCFPNTIAPVLSRHFGLYWIYLRIKMTMKPKEIFHSTAAVLSLPKIIYPILSRYSQEHDTE
jgi:hypothetical protein